MTYNSLEEVEAAQAAGEVVDYSLVKGDDGLTDEERHLKKYRDRQKDKGGAPSLGSNSQTSFVETVTTGSDTSRVHQVTVPTTELPFSRDLTEASSASSTDGSGTGQK